MRLRQFQRYKAIENQIIIKEVIAIYSMGSKELKEARYNVYYYVQYSTLNGGRKSRKKLTIMHIII